MSISKNSITSLLIITLSILSCSPEYQEKQEQKQQSSSTQPTDSLYAARIIDGDTFVLSDSTIVRIAAIDTPEHGEPLYREAGDYLASLILGRQIKLIPVGAGEDSYGRVLAEVMLDTINIGRRMLAEGYASLYLYDDNNHLKDKYLSAQIEAINQVKSIWDLPEPVAEDFYINLKGSFRFHRPLCPHIQQAKPGSIMRYDTRIEALRNGLSPCRDCKP